MKLFLAILVSFTIVLVVTGKALPVTVTTTEGQATGILQLGTRFWLNVPYAQPPVNDLRFANPKPANKYPGGASDFSANDRISCLQAGEGQEDCLYLDIIAPAESSSHYPDGFPVIVFIHGGSFFSGSKNDYVTLKYAEKNTILISINYRLSILGFLRTSNEHAGNLGFRDQVLALQWINKNVKAFGGNKKLITIAGQSAGANSVQLHVASPLSKGLFQRAITHSPLMLSYYATKDDAIATAQYFGNIVGCQWDDVTCLRSKTPQELGLAVFAFRSDCQANKIPPYQFDTDRMIWNCGLGPQIEDKVIPAQMGKVFARGEINQVPLLVGTTWNEGLRDSDGTYNPMRTQAASFYANNGEHMSESRDLYIRYLNEVTDLQDYSTNASAGQLLFNTRAQEVYGLYPYEYDEALSSIYPRLYNGIFSYQAFDASYAYHAHYSDRYYLCAARHVLHNLETKLKKKYPNVYSYVFNQPTRYRQEQYYAQPPNGFNGNAATAVVNEYFSLNLYASHGDDLYYAYPYIGVDFTPEEQALSDRIIGALINFAVTGNPGKGPFSKEIVGQWNKFSKESENYTLLEIPRHTYSIIKDHRRSICEFWDRTGFVLANKKSPLVGSIKSVLTESETSFTIHEKNSPHLRK